MLKMAMKMTLASASKGDQGEGELRLAPEGVADRDLHGATHRRDAPQADEDTVEQVVVEVAFAQADFADGFATVTRRRGSAKRRRAAAL